MGRPITVDTIKFRGTAEYNSWLAMRQRVNYAKNPVYKKYYIDKGIKVCERWNNFHNFYADMGLRPDGYSLERIDGDKDYCPENCRWASARDQMLNRKLTKWITFDSKTLSLSQWAESLGMAGTALAARLKIMSLEKALTKPRRKYPERQSPRAKTSM